MHTASKWHQRYTLATTNYNNNMFFYRWEGFGKDICHSMACMVYDLLSSCEPWENYCCNHFYSAPPFFDTRRTMFHGHTSKWYQQESEFRQARPLSPYVFFCFAAAVAMPPLTIPLYYSSDNHVPRHQTRRHTNLNLNPHRPINANFDEISFADDSIRVSSNTAASKRCRAEIKEATEVDGLKVNRNRCLGIAMNGNPKLLFEGRRQLKQVG